jgi:hypothetical protein
MTGYELCFMEMPHKLRSPDGTVSGEVFYWTNTDTELVISPLFISNYGAKKWLNHVVVNEMLECRRYQLGYHCMMFHDGNYFWFDDLSETHIGPVFDDYSNALKWKYLNSRGAI